VFHNICRDEIAIIIIIIMAMAEVD